MDLKPRRTAEFNKRVRDLVSKDRTNLREKFDKFDKQCAESLAAIQQMQEKVRFSMRNLAKEKMQIKQASAQRRHSKTARRISYNNIEGNQSPKNVKTSELKESRNTETKEEFIMKHRGSDGVIRSSSLDIPRGNVTTRRAFTPVSMFQPGSPKSSRDISKITSLSPPDRTVYASSSTKDLHSWSNRRQLSRTNEKNNTLSIDDLPMPPRSPVNLHRKLPEQLRKFSEAARSNVDVSPKRHSLENQRPRSVSVALVTVTHKTKGAGLNSRKLPGVGPKGQLTRKRSSSLPELLSLTYYSQENKYVLPPSRSTNELDVLNTTLNTTVEDNDSPLARSFEELRNCRYLRITNSSIKVLKK